MTSADELVVEIDIKDPSKTVDFTNASSADLSSISSKSIDPWDLVLEEDDKAKWSGQYTSLLFY